MKTCSEQLQDLWEFPLKCARVVGADIMDPNFHYSWLTWAVITVALTFFALCFYTFYVGIYIDDDWTAFLKGLCVVGSGVQGLAKLFTATGMRKQYRSMAEEIKKFYCIYENKRIAYQNELNNCTNLTRKFMKTFAVLYVTGVTSMLSVPVIYFLIYGEKIYVLQFFLPKVDPSTDSGYFITSTVHTICLVVGAFGNYAGDNLFFIFLLQVPLWKNILRVKFEDLNEVALSDNKKTLSLLLDILHWHQYYTNYTKTLSNIYFIVISVEILTTAVNIGMSIFVIFLGVWPAGYAYLIYSFFMLYTYCGMGTVVEIANDDVCDYVYNACLWYELSVAERKMLIVMLIKAQSPTVLTVGAVMPLSVTTGLSLTKTIYSFLMMLLNFTED